MRNSNGLGKMVRIFGIAVALGLVSGAIAGCSTAAYPTLPGLGGLGQKTLTPDEQQAKIKELAKAQADAAVVQPAVLTQPAATP